MEKMGFEMLEYWKDGREKPVPKLQDSSTKIRIDMLYAS